MGLKEVWDDYRINRIIAFSLFVIITFFSLSPKVPVPSVVKWQDKLEHIVAFGILAIFLCRSFSPNTEFSIADRIILSTLILASYGSLDEFLQGFIPTRDPSILDLMADILGAFLGGMIFRRVSFLNNVRK
jgi:VanZ family protein